MAVVVAIGLRKEDIMFSVHSRLASNRVVSSRNSGGNATYLRPDSPTGVHHKPHEIQPHSTLSQESTYFGSFLDLRQGLARPTEERIVNLCNA